MLLAAELLMNTSNYSPQLFEANLKTALFFFLLLLLSSSSVRRFFEIKDFMFFKV